MFYANSDVMNIDTVQQIPDHFFAGTSLNVKSTINKEQGTPLKRHYNQV